MNTLGQMNYHFAANDKFLRYKKSVPSVNMFLHKFYMTWHSNNKTVIVNQGTWDRLNPRERNKVRLIQLNVGAVVANNKVRMYTGIKTHRGTNSITKFAMNIRKITIPPKYLQKLRAKYSIFNLIEFDEWHFPQLISTHMGFYPDDFHHYSHYQWPRYKFIVFGSFNRNYHKWFKYHTT